MCKKVIECEGCGVPTDEWYATAGIKGKNFASFLCRECWLADQERRRKPVDYRTFCNECGATDRSLAKESDFKYHQGGWFKSGTCSQCSSTKQHLEVKEQNWNYTFEFGY